VPRVAGIVLAGGLSTRLGRPKQLVELCGKPALQHVLDVARRTRLHPIVVVVNPALVEALGSFDTRGCAVVVNERASEGQSTSLRAGLAALPPEVDAAVFLLGDQPFVDPETIEELLDCFERTGAPIVRPRYADGPGNPVLIARRYFAELAQLTGDVGARPLLVAHADEIIECDRSARPAPLDLDTPEDVERARRLCSERQAES